MNAGGLRAERSAPSRRARLAAAALCALLACSALTSVGTQPASAQPAADPDNSEGPSVSSEAAVVISLASLAVDEDDSDGADVATYTIKLATQPTAKVTVTPTSSDSTAATVSSAVSFTTTNWSNAKKVTVTAVDDDIDNAGDSRSVTISHTVTGGDYATVTAPSVSVSVADDDTAAVVVSDTAVVAAENAGTATYTVKLASQPTASVTVTPTSGTTTAATVSGALTFTTTDWGTAQTVTVTGVNDSASNTGGHRAATISHTVAGGDYATVTAPAVSAFVIDDDSTPTPAVCNRTAAVRDTIVASVSGKTACADITWLDLAGVTDLNLSGQRMAALASGDFDGLVDLRILRLNDTRLPQVPSGIFDKNTELRDLYLGTQSLSSLPSGIFDKNTALEMLSLARNQLTSLPTGIFDKNTDLTDLTLVLNQLTSLPANVFDSNTKLIELSLGSNQLTTLPSNAFDNNTALESLDLGRNRLTSIEAGLFDNNTELEWLGLHINQLASLPAGIFDNHTALRTLWLSHNRLTSLPADAFDNNTEMKGLYIDDNQLTSIESGAFDNNPLLDSLRLSDNPLTSLPTGVFDNNTKLGTLWLRNARLASLPSGVFDKNTKLTELLLGGNLLTAVPASTFDNNVRLRTLTLDRNRLTTLPAGVFTRLTRLRVLTLGFNQFSSLPASLFSTNTKLRGLFLGGSWTLEETSSDPWWLLLDGWYTGASLVLDDGIFSGLTKLRTLSLDHLGLRCLPAIPSKVTGEALKLDDDVTSERTRASYPSCSAAGRLPRAPSDVTVASASSTSATLSWTLPSGIWSSVDVRWRSLTSDDEPASEWSSRNIAGASVTQATVASMTASTTYQFEVRVNDATRKGVWSRRVSLPSGRGPGVGPSDAAAVVVSPTSVVVDENAGTATYTIKLATQPSASVTVTPASSDSAAATVSGALTFTTTNWNVARTVTVTGVNNHSGGSRGATISHTVAGGDYATVTAPSVAVAVRDDDNAAVAVAPTAVSVDEDAGTATYTIKLATQPSADVTVTPTSDTTTAATVSGALTFTTTNWNDAQTVTVTGVDDNVDNTGGNRSATISHTVAGGDYATVTAPSVTVTVSDDDHAALVISPTTLTVDEDGGTATYTIKLATQPSTDVTVTPTSDTTTAATVSGALTFTSTNWNNAQTVTVTGVDDNVDNTGGSREVAIVNYTAGGGYANVSAPLVTVFVTDNNKGVLVSVDAVVVEEDAGTVTYTVNLATQPSASVTVTPTSSDSTTATVSGALTFTTANWNTAQEVTVTGVDDDVDNTGGNRTAAISHTVAGGGYGTVTAPSVAVTVSDDDDAAVVIAPAAVTVAENAGTATYTVKLATKPSADVTVTPASSDSTAATVSAALTFTTTNWGTAQNVTVTGVDDTSTNSGGSRSATISHTVAGGGYASVSAPSVAVTVSDDDSTPSPAVCDRTAKVRDAIVAAVSGKAECALISAHDLAALTTLNLSNQSLTALTAGDFNGLAGLETLRLHENQITSLPSGIFDEATSLTTLELDDNRLASLPANVFGNNTKLTSLQLYDNLLTSLPSGIFDNNTELTSLQLYDNLLTSLPTGVFDNNAKLTSLSLGDNRLASLPSGIFDSNAALTTLYLHGNELTTLAAGAFTNNTALTDLALGYNRFSTLPASLFSTNAELVGLYLGGSWYYPALGWVTLPGYYNGESLVLPDAIFSGLTKLKYLSLDDAGLQCLPAIPASVRHLKLDEDLSSDRTRASYPSCGSDSRLPAPVTNLATPTANADSATLSWSLPAGTWSGVDVRWRSVGADNTVSAWSPASVAGSATQTTIALPSSGQQATSDLADANGPPTGAGAVAQTGSAGYQFEVRVNSSSHKGLWSRRVSVPAGIGPGVAPVDDTGSQPPRRGSNNDGNDGGSPTGGTGGGGGGSGAARPERLSGADRWATAAAVSNKLVELLEAADPATGARTQVDTVIVASGQAFPDALTAAALSRTLRAPLLLTSKTRLEQPVRAFIARHRPITAVIVGGPAAVSTDVEAELLAMNEIGAVVRHAGPDRYATAAKIAAAVGGPARLCGTATPTVIVTTGRNYPDALVAGPLAYRGPHPILLTEPHTLPDPIRDWLAGSAAKHAIVIGGEKAVSKNVLDELRGLGLTAERLSGADRADTSATVARRLTSLVGTSGCFRKDAVGLATGWAFPDALAAAPLLGRYGAPLLLTSPNGVPQALIDYFAAGLLEPDFDLPPITTIGGRTAVPTAHYNKLLANLPR